MIFFWALRLLVPRWPLAWRLVAALSVEVFWELLENSPWIIDRYRQQTASLDYTGDSILNSLSDVAAALAGFALAVGCRGKPPSPSSRPWNCWPS